MPIQMWCKVLNFYPRPKRRKVALISLTHVSPSNTISLHFDSADSFHSFDGSKHGIFLEVPPYTVSTLSSLHSHILCSLVSDEFFISPVGANETLVSYIVDFDSSSFEMNRKRPVIVTLSHSGADESLGYETVVKTFDKYQMPCRWRDRKGTF